MEFRLAGDMLHVSYFDSECILLKPTTHRGISVDDHTCINYINACTCKTVLCTAVHALIWLHTLAHAMGITIY